MKLRLYKLRHFKLWQFNFRRFKFRKFKVYNSNYNCSNSDNLKLRLHFKSKLKQIPVQRNFNWKDYCLKRLWLIFSQADMYYILCSPICSLRGGLAASNQLFCRNSKTFWITDESIKDQSVLTTCPEKSSTSYLHRINRTKIRSSI